MAEGWTLITGGNRGLGLGLAQKLVASGRQVLLASRTHDKAAEAARRIGQETARPGAVQPLELDVSQPRSVTAAVAAVRRDYNQRVACLVNNAGIYPPEWNQATWDAAVATNFEGPVSLIEQLHPHMAEGGRIVNVSSELGELHRCSHAYGCAVMGADSLDELRAIEFNAADAQQAAGVVPAYCVTKAMLNRATQILSRDQRLRRHGVTVSVVTPGWCRTDMGGGSAPRSPEEGVESLFWNATFRPSAAINGGFFMDGRPHCW